MKNKTFRERVKDLEQKFYPSTPIKRIDELKKGDRARIKGVVITFFKLKSKFFCFLIEDGTENIKVKCNGRIFSKILNKTKKETQKYKTNPKGFEIMTKKLRGEAFMILGEAKKDKNINRSRFMTKNRLEFIARDIANI